MGLEVTHEMTGQLLVEELLDIGHEFINLFKFEDLAHLSQKPGNSPSVPSPGHSRKGKGMKDSSGGAIIRVAKHDIDMDHFAESNTSVVIQRFNISKIRVESEPA